MKVFFYLSFAAPPGKTIEDLLPFYETGISNGAPCVPAHGGHNILLRGGCLPVAAHPDWLKAGLLGFGVVVQIGEDPLLLALSDLRIGRP